jgi:uncharacterized protein (DUF1330 family)
VSAGSLEPTAEQLQRLAQSTRPGAVVMLNLLRFKDQADGIDSADGISGRAAYERYGLAVVPHLDRVGGRVLHMADSGAGVIGPAGEEWDMLLLVRYPSRAAFLAMIADPDYQAIHGHRAAALADSRLVCFDAAPGDA